MAYVVPLIRAAALMPLVRWMSAEGHSVGALLDRLNLSTLVAQGPLQPVPLVSAMELLRLGARLEGPDIACRVISESSPLELLLLGKVAIGTRNPREAANRIAHVLPYFCTHEHLTLAQREKDVIVRHFFAVKSDPELRHLIHQYVTAMLKALCAMSGAAEPYLKRVEMAPHPEHGISHLEQWFGSHLAATRDRTLSVTLSKDTLDTPFPVRGRDRMRDLKSSGLQPLHGDGTYSGSVRLLIAGMIEGDNPTIERLSAAAGTSVRTFQRRLDAEGTSFSALLDDVRRARAIEKLSECNIAVGQVSAELGYARQASLTRAVRRWTGRSPSSYRSEGASG